MPELERLVRLGELAHTRSGDKGDRSNIGVVANDDDAFAWLETHLTSSAVALFLRPMGIGQVKRYDLRGLLSFNFVVDHALAGGASRSLRLDSQGKALGVVLLEMQIPRSAGSLSYNCRGAPLMSTSLVIREDRGPVTVLTMNRPDRRNALSRALMADLRDAIDQLSVDLKVRAIVLTGSGTAFCAGMDLKEAAALDAALDAEEQTIATLQEFAELLQRLHTLPKPTIAAVNGDAIAGGAGLMTACDAAIAAEVARIGYPEVRRGLVAAIVMHDLTRQVGDRRARELLLGGGLISATTAQRWGLVNEVTTNDLCLNEAIRVAEGLAECGPAAVATTKRLLDEVAGRPRDLRGAAAVSAATRLSDEAREGMLAFIEKRPPAWAWSELQEKVP